MKTRIGSRVALILIIALSVACGQRAAQQAATPIAQGGDEYGIPENPTWGRAVVASDVVADLVAYEAKFREVLGDNDLEKHLIGCVAGCSELSSAPSPKRIVYHFAREHQNILAIFGEAWDATVESAGDTGYRLTFDADVPPAVCDPPHPQPCQFMPPCPDMCGRRAGGCGAC